MHTKFPAWCAAQQYIHDLTAIVTFVCHLPQAAFRDKEFMTSTGSVYLLSCQTASPAYSTHWRSGWVRLDPTHPEVRRRKMRCGVPETWETIMAPPPWALDRITTTELSRGKEPSASAKYLLDASDRQSNVTSRHFYDIGSIGVSTLQVGKMRLGKVSNNSP